MPSLYHSFLLLILPSCRLSFYVLFSVDRVFWLTNMYNWDQDPVLFSYILVLSILGALNPHWLLNKCFWMCKFNSWCKLAHCMGNHCCIAQIKTTLNLEMFNECCCIHNDECHLQKVSFMSCLMLIVRKQRIFRALSLPKYTKERTITWRLILALYLANT